MDEPSATPIARSILFLQATNTAVMCSHALPAMGSTMSPRNAWLSPLDLLTSSSAPVRNLRRSSTQLGLGCAHTAASRRGFSSLAQSSQLGKQGMSEKCHITARFSSWHSPLAFPRLAARMYISPRPERHVRVIADAIHEERVL